MPITLKHINYSDSDSIKLDKVNYNFDQLVANGGGPRGPQGPIGQSGPQGTTGQQGFQGPVGDIGYQGPPGPVTDNYWNKEAITLSTSETVDYIVPIHTSINPVIQFAPVVNIGYIDTEAQYGIKDPLVGGRTPYQWLIKRKTYSSSNLRLLNGDALANGIDFKLEKSLGKDKLTIGFIEYANSPVSTYKAAATFFRGTSASPYSLLIDTTSATFGTNTVFDSPVIVKERLIIQDPTAGTDKIVVSQDVTGLSKFKSVQELGGTVPYGTIVSILPAIFADNTKFINTETVNPGMGVVPISVGKGIGNYEGWYLCNGQEWTDGTTNYLVPMLGKFNYDIEDNPFTTDPS
ncbi:MAG: collagen-like triple helix repeat-containing protein, partial [Dolichospermum sp.]